jgi:HJR/Mrr/RecB family endonuclease
LIAYNLYESIAIQCKRWKQIVRVEAIREAHTAKDIYKTKRAMVITNSYFTDDAIKLAEKLHIELWDRNRLIQEIMKSI